MSCFRRMPIIYFHYLIQLLFSVIRLAIIKSNQWQCDVTWFHIKDWLTTSLELIIIDPTFWINLYSIKIHLSLSWSCYKNSPQTQFQIENILHDNYYLPFLREVELCWLCQSISQHKVTITNTKTSY